MAVQRRLKLIALASGLAVLSAAASASGQAIERNLPPAPKALEPAITPPAPVPADQDATPIGPKLTGIVVLAGTAPAIASPAAGIDVSRDRRLANDRRALKRFLGRPLSRKLIAQIEAQIARHYRDAGFPFVNLSTPEQDITSGVLQVRALEFRLGTKTAPGAKGKAAAYILSRVRVSPGDVIDAEVLAQDLDWLNRYPFRHTEAQFSPGTSTGLTDLSLPTTSSKPWSAYVGYSDSGSPLTGWDRYFAGFETALPGLHDALASFQATASGNALFDDNDLFHVAAYPSYVSDAGRLVIPTLPRQDIEATLNYVQTYQPVQAFLARNMVVEATLAYRAALSDVAPAMPGEIVLGIEAKHDDSQTFLGAGLAKAASIDVFQATFGYADQLTDALGHASADVTLHVSPGGLDTRNSDAAFSAFSSAAAADARYAYVNGDLTRYTRLPRLFGLTGFAIVNTLTGQYAAVRLPLTEQMGLGGAGLVRGYTLDDGAFDSAIASRNELHAPSFSLFHRTGPFADVTSPYLFVDAGYAQMQGGGVTAHMTSTGMGTDFQLGPHLSAGVDGAWTLEKAGLTPAGAVRLESRVTFSF